MILPKGPGAGTAASNTIQQMKSDLNKGRGLNDPSLALIMEQIDSAVTLKDEFIRKYGPDAVDELRDFANLQTSLLMAEMRQMQVNQYRDQLVPVDVVTEIRDRTVQLINDTLGAAYIAQLVFAGVPEESAKRGREDMLAGLRSLYTRYAQEKMGT